MEADEEGGDAVGIFGEEARVAEVLEEERRKQQVDRGAGHAPPVRDRGHDRRVVGDTRATHYEATWEGGVGWELDRRLQHPWFEGHARLSQT